MKKACLSFAWLAALAGLCALSGCSKSQTSAQADPAALSDGASGIEDDSDGTNWPAYGRTHAEGHDSPLTEINGGNIQRLGLSSATDLADVPGAATVPIAVDGVVYLAIGPSIVHAVDAASGKLLWQYDPQVYRVAGHKMRAVWGIRGRAYWKGRIYVGTTDGRLIAIDAKRGQPVWTTQTTDPGSENYITGAPRTFRGLVLIGNGGADTGKSRGYVTAYNAQTGRQVWRFYVVPGDPAKGFENDAMKMAASTWTGQWWKFGGGGNPWNALTYDAEQNLVYIGTGNGAPWNRNVRSPGGGDNLFLSSIVALDADTGRYRWHYQVNPGESWDYNAAMDMQLATLTIAGKPRKVLMQAPKNGFFYVIDRTNGKLISAQKFAKVTWASHVDPNTGRPVELPGIRYDTGPATIYPSPFGAHGWMPMAYNRQRGLVFIPKVEVAGSYSDRTVDRAKWRPGVSVVNTATDDPPASPTPGKAGSSTLLAWDPVMQRKVWEVPTPGIWNGGLLTTAGDLVFQGQIDGKFVAYAAQTGRPLWSFDAGLAINGAPITFKAAGKQYIAVVVGFGGGANSFMGIGMDDFGWNARQIQHRLFLFALDGKAARPASQRGPRPALLDDSSLQLEPKLVQLGAGLFYHNCGGCHGLGAFASGYAPDLRASPVRLNQEAFRSVVHDGLLVERGMPRFEELADRDLLAIRQYVTDRARAGLAGASSRR